MHYIAQANIPIARVNFTTATRTHLAKVTLRKFRHSAKHIKRNFKVDWECKTSLNWKALERINRALI